MKPPLSGLLSRSGRPPDAYLPVMGGWVKNITWASLQPTPLDYDWSVAEAALEEAEDAGKLLKIRLMAGIHAPDWLKAEVGVYAIPTIGATCPLFWTDAYQQEYRGLLDAFAKRLDGDPALAEVTVAGAMTEFCEPFIRQRNDPAATADMLAAGWTRSGDFTAQLNAVEAHQALTNTCSSLSTNPFQDITLPSGQTDMAFTQGVMGIFRARLGERAVLQNNSIRWPPQDGEAYWRLHATIREAGDHISYQTATYAKVGDLLGALAWAVGVGARSVELPSGYENHSPEALAPYHQGLLNNALQGTSKG